MSKKSFKIARKPGQGNNGQSAGVSEPKRKATIRRTTNEPTKPTSEGFGPTTRKTIEVPEDYFFWVKKRALYRKMLEKELWAEILSEYFENHPDE
ncbi:MAG: hypothetical protein M3362_13525 [Acidobacteriota bacterium]|nr:hypothetical protein [Acidobacteriota bacterium]